MLLGFARFFGGAIFSRSPASSMSLPPATMSAQNKPPDPPDSSAHETVRQSYATILARYCTSSNLMAESSNGIVSSHGGVLSKKGDVFCVKIDEEIYKQRLALCQTSIIGRVIQSRGDLPWKLVDLKSKL